MQSYSIDGGKTTFNALLFHGDPTKKTLFALKLVDELFCEDELIELNPVTKKDELLSHPSYLFIKGLLQLFFNIIKRLIVCKEKSSIDF